MKKTLFYGLGVFVLGFILMFLSGSKSGPNLTPTVPFLYGTNQSIYLFIAVIGVIMVVVGLIGVIVKALRKPKQ